MGCGLCNVLKRAPWRTSSGACVSGAGLKCPYGGGNFTALSGSITIPANYASKVQCDYLITTGKAIYLIFDSFSTEEAYDFVTVYDGTSMNSLPLLGEFSGTTTPGVLAAKSGSVFVRFTSDGGGSADGVGMRWSDTAPATLAPTPPLPTYSPDGTPCTLCDGSGIEWRVPRRQQLAPAVGPMRTLRHVLEPSLC